MTSFKLLKAEILHRKTNFALSMFAIVAAATLFVAGPTLMRGYGHESNHRLDAMQKETEVELIRLQDKNKEDLANLDKRTKRIMRDLGFNLRIVHKDTQLAGLYADFVSIDMPEEYIQRLANAPEITKIVHLVATLKQMSRWEEKPCLIVGFAPESTQSHIEKKTPMGFQIEQGTVFLGYALNDVDGKPKYKAGDEIEVLGHKFKIARLLPEHGSRDNDIAIAMHLKDAQKLLDKPGKISEIVALGCKCKTVERIEEIREQLALVLPEAQVNEHRLNAIAREDQRKLVTRHAKQTQAEYAANREKIIGQEKAGQQQILNLLNSVTSFITPLIVLVCGVWVGLLAWSNVRERRSEIGLLRALGKKSLNIASLFLGKAIILGICGGMLGCLLGYGLAIWLASEMLHVAAENFKPAFDVLAMTVIGAPLVAAMSSYLPTLSAVAQDPAVVLMEE